LLGDVSGGAGTAGRVEHEVARIGGHEEATLDDSLGRLHYINFVHRTATLHVVPEIRYRENSEVSKIAFISEIISADSDAAGK
jgi:hypothetical protein